MLCCNGERLFQDWGCISGYVLPAEEKPCTAAGWWQTMLTSKPQLWNCGVVRGDTRYPWCLTRVKSSVQTLIKKPGKGWSNQALQYFFFKSAAAEKINRKGWQRGHFLLSSSICIGIFQIPKYFLMFYWPEIWNCPSESLSSFQCLPCRSRKQNQLKQLLYWCTVCPAYLHKLLSHLKRIKCCGLHSGILATEM